MIHLLDPTLILINMSNHFSDSILEILQQKNILTDRSLEESHIVLAQNFITDDDQNFFVHFVSYLRFLLMNFKNRENIYLNFKKNLENIKVDIIQGTSDVLFEYINNNNNNNNNNQTDTTFLKNKGLVNNFKRTPKDPFSSLINYSIKNNFDPKSVILKLNTNCNCLKWPNDFLKNKNTLKNFCSTPVSDEHCEQINTDILIGILCFLNLLLKEKLINICIDMLEMSETIKYDFNIENLNLSNLKIFSSMVLYSLDLNLTSLELKNKSDIILEIFISNPKNFIKSKEDEEENNINQTIYQIDLLENKKKSPFDQEQNIFKTI